VAVDSGGSVYVTETWNNRIQKFGNDGTFQAQWGTTGSGPGQFSSPSGIAADAGGNVYVADSGNYRIQKFSSAGAFLAQWGTRGSGPGQFSYPSGIAVAADGNIYVTDSYNCSIQKFDSNGNFLAQWGTSGSGPGQFSSPAGVAVDIDRNVYSADSGNQRIQKFDHNGNFLTQWGTSGTANGQFSLPVSLAVDTYANVYVADYYNHRIQKFRPEVAPEDAVCGIDNGKTLTATPTNLCAPGTLIEYSGTGPWNWICQGNYGGANALCSAAFVEPSPVILVGSSQRFSSLQQAYDAAGDGATIKARAEVPAEKLVPGSTGKKVYVLGGYEATFTTQTGYTAILGKFTISRESIVLNRVIIR
jgi:sugar lactone lactonase YvrE